MKIPFAIQHDKKMRVRGNYPGPNAGPKGCVVHFTAGQFADGVDSAKDMLAYGASKGFAYLCIAQGGEVLQAHDVNKWGFHAGESAWKHKLKKFTRGILGTVSDELIGIEICNAGLLNRITVRNPDGSKVVKFKSWYGKTIEPSEVRVIEEKETVKYLGKDYAWNCPSGPYHRFTQAQEDALIATIMWLYVNCEDFKLEHVFGHHEVSGKLGIGYFRKNDPGGALSMPMEMFRAYLMENKDALIVKFGIKIQRD